MTACIKKKLLEASGFLKDVIEDTLFLNTYPNICKLEIQLIYGDGLIEEAEYNPEKNLIYAQSDKIEKLKPLIVHEIQHAIQYEEDFALGGDPDMYKRDNKGKLRKYKDRYNDYLNLAGEIEARDVQTRANYTSAQRKLVKPFSSEDISTDKADIIYKKKD